MKDNATWLIERGQEQGQTPTVWRKANGGWTTVAYDAQEFVTKAAAEAVIKSALTHPTRGAWAVATAHMFLPATTATPIDDAVRRLEEYVYAGGSAMGAGEILRTELRLTERVAFVAGWRAREKHGESSLNPLIHPGPGKLLDPTHFGALEGWLIRIAQALGLDTSQGVTGGDVLGAIEALQVAAAQPLAPEHAGCPKCEDPLAHTPHRHADSDANMEVL